MSDELNEESQTMARKPQNTKFRQQKLSASRPLLTPGNLYPFFLSFGIVCICIGIPLHYSDKQVQEFEKDYTKNCLNVNNESCHNHTAKDQPCRCNVSFTLLEDFKAPVIMYYGLTNFYQNHRSYVKSRDDNQLLGNIAQTPDKACYPLDQNGGKNYIPCGAIANSLFSDTITLTHSRSGAVEKVGLIRTGIALDVDKKYKFKNPIKTENNKTLKDVFEDASYIRPKDWHLDIWELDKENEDNNGLQNEDLMVWMRTAALPDFRKIYRRIDHKGSFTDGLPSGNYTLEIEYRYNVTAFGGTKSIILSNTSILGGKNNFFGVAYISFGCISVFLAILLFFIESYKKPGA